MLEKLLKRTQFKNDAKEIARRIEKSGLTLDTIADAPRFFGYRLYGHNTYQVVAAILEASKLPEIETRPLKAPVSEPLKDTLDKDQKELA